MTKRMGAEKPSIDELMHQNEEEEILHTMSLGEDFLEHHGVKGMKWGVKKAGGAAGGAAGAWRNNKQASLARTGSGGGSKVDYARSLSTTSVGSLARNHGTRGAAKVQANNIAARQARLAEGKGSKVDKVMKYRSSAGAGAYSLGGKNKDTKFTAEKDKLAVNKSDHAVTKKVKADHNTLSDGHFERKYNVSKSNYRKRVAKHGDPYQAAVKRRANLDTSHD